MTSAMVMGVNFPGIVSACTAELLGFFLAEQLTPENSIAINRANSRLEDECCIAGH